MELNKIAAAILLAGLIGMITGKAAGFLYGGADEHVGEHKKAERGYRIEVAEGAGDAAATPKKEEKLPSLVPLLADADAAAGEAYFSKKCALCHTAEKGGSHKTGPNLWNVVGHPKASKEGFNYSKAIQERGGQWGYEELNGFLHKPKKYLPGTIMAYAGTRKAEDRADVIAYLRTLSDNPQPLPQVEAQDEAVEPATATANEATDNTPDVEAGEDAPAEDAPAGNAAE